MREIRRKHCSPPVYYSPETVLTDKCAARITIVSFDAPESLDKMSFMKLIAKTIGAGVVAVAPSVACDLSWPRESNLLQGIDEWLPVGKASYTKQQTGYLLENGMLEHFLDWDNAEHAAADCTFPADKIMEFKVRARGHGSFRLGIDAVRMGGSFGDFTMTTRFTQHATSVRSQSFLLTEEWKDYTFRYQERDSGTIGHQRVFCEPAEGASVYLLSASMIYKAAKDFNIIFEPNSAIACPGDRVDFVITCDKKNYPLNIRIYDGHHRISNGMESMVMTTDDHGRIPMSVTMVSAAFEGMRITASDPGTGVKKSFFISEVSPAFKKEFASKKITALPFRRILFLGDSLTDYDRGRNYVDLVKLYVPLETSLCNAGVGGDYVGRSLARLKGEYPVDRERYDGIFDKKPDLVIIFFGANDTKTSSADGFKEPMTPPEAQYKAYKELLNLLRKKCAPNVKFMFILHSPGYYPDQKQAARRRVQAGKSAARFNETCHVLKYIEVLKKIAQEENIDLIDAYSAMSACPDLRELYISNDGIHMTLKGHRFLAGLVVDHLKGYEVK